MQPVGPLVYDGCVPAPVLVLFSLACAPPCSAKGEELRVIEKDVVRLLGEHAYEVKPAPLEAVRPTGNAASELTDEAGRLNADRVLVLDLEPKERALWLTHYVRGFAGPWSVGQVVCARNEKNVLSCPEIERVLVSGLRPRKAADVDVTSLLRHQATRVGLCIREEDDVPIDERTFGRVEMDLEALPAGRVRVLAIAPAIVAKKTLGRCLREAMESMNVGAFEGEPIRFRIPVDLD
jgi:hypothetical protein